MNNRLQNIAKAAVQMSELMQGREKIETENIIKYHGEGITINQIDKVTAEDGDFYVYTFEEEPEKFAFSGFVLNKIFDNLLKDYEGDFDGINGDLEKYGLRVKLTEGKTKNKRQITNVEVL